jgi:hypothetical protein
MGQVADVNIESEKHIVSLLKWAETRVEKVLDLLFPLFKNGVWLYLQNTFLELAVW